MGFPFPDDMLDPPVPLFVEYDISKSSLTFVNHILCERFSDEDDHGTRLPVGRLGRGGADVGASKLY